MGMRAVFLVGFMGSGKTTVGQELARRLGWHFVDLDSRIEAREHQTVPEIFRLRGEPAFRFAETSTLTDLLTNPPERNVVVALGGGAFVQEKNRELLTNLPIVFLDAPADQLWRRCQQDKAERPLRQDPAQFATLYARRLPFYRQASLVVQTSGKPVASICLEIEHALGCATPPENDTPKSSSIPPANQAPSK
jgi:shikimate kinase